MHFQVEYHSRNHYDNIVQNSHWQLLVLPENSPHQRLISYSYNSNLKLQSYISAHLFSGKILNLTAKRFKDFSISVTSFVELSKNNPFDFDLLTIDEEKAYFKNHSILVENSHFLFPCEFTKVEEEKALKFPLWKKGHLLHYLQNLMSALQEELWFVQSLPSS